MSKRKSMRMSDADKVQGQRIKPINPITECLDCGEALHAVRIRHGFTLCVSCAQEQEREREQTRRGK